MAILRFPWNFHGFLSIYCEILNICNIYNICWCYPFSLVCVQVDSNFRSQRERDLILYLYLFSETDLAIYLFHSSPLYIWFGIQFCDLRFVSLIWISIRILHLNPQYIVNPEQSSDFINISEDFILVYCEIFRFIRIYFWFVWVFQCQGNFRFFNCSQY